MGSSGGSGTGNPMYLSQGGVPMPGLPIAGQGAPNDNPRNFGSFQNFLPDIPPAGQGPAPLAHGLTAEMLQYRSPQGGAVQPVGGGTGSGGGGGGGGSADLAAQVSALRQQLAALQARGGNGQFGAAGSGTPDWTNGSYVMANPGG